MKTVLIYSMMAIMMCVTAGLAQTVNQGTMVVMPGTIMSTVSDFDNKPTGDFFNDGEMYVYANFNNDGLVTFTPGPATDGYTRFQGSTTQKISGSLPSEFKDVLFFNTSIQPAFQLSGDISIAGDSEFNQGIVNNDDFGGTISFEQGGTHTNTWNGSHLDGVVTKKGSTEFQYPIGDKNLYRYARISAPTDVASKFSGKYFFEDSNPMYSHASKQPEIELINNKEYWTLTKDAWESSDILLTLSWDETTTTPADVIAAPESEIHIVRWDETLNMWVDEGGVADVLAKTVTTAVEVTGYGVFTLARVKVEDTPCVKIYNAVTPNADTFNDYFYIECINNFPNNTVEVFNRWGVKVYDTNNYDSHGNVFAGYSEGRTTIDGSRKLPTGTYFYILTYEMPSETGNRTKKQAGYLYLNAD